MLQKTLKICVALCEAGVNPESLAAVVKELRREAQAAGVVRWPWAWWGWRSLAHSRPVTFCCCCRNKAPRPADAPAA